MCLWSHLAVRVGRGCCPPLLVVFPRDSRLARAPSRVCMGCPSRLRFCGGVCAGVILTPPTCTPPLWLEPPGGDSDRPPPPAPAARLRGAASRTDVNGCPPWLFLRACSGWLQSSMMGRAARAGNPYLQLYHPDGSEYRGGISAGARVCHGRERGRPAAFRAHLHARLCSMATVCHAWCNFRVPRRRVA